ncbi:MULTISPECIES: phage tail length tape measure family protein [Methylosinus]|uniref:Bacteriophage tail tape measure N-terminal domain-containing protein n=1 Tax=Methylosinus trichosporium (strain ATCC 35070 / NCIMB 11131 / UNIQEM 75 / OB3b) TaxID=595536 RepID=A0A2D2CX65_METT3|nr:MULTISPECIES: phage tail length tape measure family protein [Methylosinus]ATQ67358.1 hypothetical protein CQW49_05210 [Methylosinus trichosporium OB3b]OBS51628.1 hypothetical protein A8B73_15570 [Methylosinus sp. 3S-1]
MAASVGIRLQTTGGEEVVRVLEKISSAAETQFKKSAAEARAFGRAVTDVAAELQPDRLVSGLSQAAAPRWSQMTSRMSLLRPDTAATNDGRAQIGGFAQHQWLNLNRQGQDAITMLASGSSMMQVFSTQAAQVYDVFASSKGGAASGVKAFSSAVAGAVTPTRLLGATIVGTAATSVIALTRFKSTTDELQASLDGLGRFSGVSLTDARGLAENASAASGMSLRSSSHIVAGALGAGLDANTAGGVAALSKQFSIKLGMGLDDAAKELTDALADPAKGADELAKRYGLVTLAQGRHIDELTKVGDRSGAAAELLRDLRGALDRIADRRSPFSRLIDRVETGASDVLTSYGEALANNPANRTVNRLFGVQGNESASTVFARMRSGELQRQQAARQADLAGQDVYSIVRETAPDLFARRDLEQQVERFQRALGREGVGKVLDDLGVSGDMTREAVERLKTSLEMLKTPMQRVGEENALRMRSIEAETIGQKAQLAAEQAYRAELDNSKDKLAAAMAAEGARNATIAESTRVMREQAKQAEQRVELAGLKPYERAKREAELTLREDLRKANLAPGAGARTDIYTKPAIDGFASVGTAATRLADVLTGSADRIGRLISAPEQRAATASPTLLFARNGGDFYSAIQRAEGTDRFGDPYNTSLGYMRSPKPLVDMTMSESLAWGDQVRRAQGLNSSAKGAFQITNTTQRDAMRALGLGANDMFNAENQNRMADWIFKTQGVGAWEGFKSHPAERATAQTAGLGAQSRQLDEAGEAWRKYDATVKAINIEQVDTWLKGENESLDMQRHAIDLSSNSWGLNVQQLAAAEERQRLLNEAQQRGIPLTEELTRRVGELSQKAAESARINEQTRKQIAELDFARDATTNVASSAAIAAAHGENVGDALKSSLRQVEDDLIRKSVGNIVGGLLGERGSSNMGLFGDVLGLNGKTGRDVQMTANNVTIGGAGSGGLLGGALNNGRSGGGLFGNLLDSGGSGGGLLSGLFGPDRNANFAGQAAGAIGPFQQTNSGGDLLPGLTSVFEKGFGSLLGGSGSGAGTITIKGNVVNVSGGSLSGLGGGGSGGFLSNIFGGSGGGSSGGGDVLGDVFSIFSTIGGFFGFANGGVMSGRGVVSLQRYEKGGVADRPQLALFGEGRHREAYIPMPDPRGLHVAVAADGRAHVTLPDGRGIPAVLEGRERLTTPGGSGEGRATPLRLNAFAGGGVMTSAGPAPLSYASAAAPSSLPPLRMSSPAAVAVASGGGAGGERRPVEVKIMDARGGNQVEKVYATHDEVMLMISARESQVAKGQANAGLKGW